MNKSGQLKQLGEDPSTRQANCLPIHPEINLRSEGVVAFVGCSMKPTLLDGDLVEVLPYVERTVQVGDIIYYQFPNASKAIIHRVVRITPAGVIARGDNNPVDDKDPIPSQFILGQVTAVWRGSRRRKMVGGPKGMVYYKIHKVFLAYGGAILPILRPLYHLLIRGEGVSRCLPQRFRPKVTAFRDGKKNHLRLVWWGRVVGEYDFDRHRWNIDRPYRLLLSGKVICPKSGFVTKMRFFPYHQEIKK